MTIAGKVSLFVLLSVLGTAQDVQTEPATDGHFVVAISAFRDYPFAVGEGVREVRLSGKFRAPGGKSNAIIVLVLNDDQYARWQKQPPNPPTPENGGAFYSSGRVDRGTVNVQFPDTPANYHVVFNNRHSPTRRASRPT